MKVKTFFRVAKLLAEELKQPAITAPTKISPKQKKASPQEPKREDPEEFSDSNDNATADEMDVESVERLDSFDNDDTDERGMFNWKFNSMSYHVTLK